MTAMSKLRAIRLVRMCRRSKDYDPKIVTPPVQDDDGRLHWQVSYFGSVYSVSVLSGRWYISRVEACVFCPAWDPSRDDVMLY